MAADATTPGQPHWLFGSMHIRDNRVYQFGEKLYPLISNSDCYVGEMELEQQPEIMLTNHYDLKKASFSFRLC
jgi:uncharacterized protein YbaP (TraB family)